MRIPMKMEDFFNAEISFYSRRKVSVDFSQRFSTKQIKCRYLLKIINEKSLGE